MSSFKVMTFNVRGIHDDGINSWEHRADLNVRTIKTYAPDIIGFQEAQSGNLTTYEAELSDYDCELGPISIRETELYHRLPIYWRPERFECVEHGGFYLSRTPEIFSVSWGGRLVRAVNWVKLHDKLTDVTFVHLNTHLDHEIELVRDHSAQLIVEQLERIRQDLPALITADFNALPTSRTYKIFNEAGYHDTYQNASVSVNTFHGFKGNDFESRNTRIDWILVDAGTSHSVEVDSCVVIEDAEPPIYPSDHYPVLAQLKLIKAINK